MRHRNELPELFTTRGYDKVVEVGVQRGDFSNIVLSKWHGSTYVMVDVWQHMPGYRDICNVSDQQQEAVYEAAMAVAERYAPRVKVLIGESVLMAEEFADGSLDAVYLDADHSKAAVLADLEAWMPKIRRGGAICGHDYLDGVLPEGDFGVKSAVLEFFGREPDIVTLEPWPTWLVDLS